MFPLFKDIQTMDVKSGLADSCMSNEVMKFEMTEFPD